MPGFVYYDSVLDCDILWERELPAHGLWLHPVLRQLPVGGDNEVRSP